MSMNKIEIEDSLQPSIRDSRGLIQVQPNEESFFGETLIQRTLNYNGESVLPVGVTKSQNFAHEL